MPSALWSVYFEDFLRCDRRRALVCLAVACAVLLSVLPVSAFATAPYQFAEAGTLAISESQLTATGGVKVRLLNNTGTRYTLVVRAAGFAFQPQVLPGEVKLRVAPERTLLRASSHATVTLSMPAQTTNLAKGVYSGELVVSPYRAHGPTIRREMTIEAGTAATPAVKTLNMRAEWLLPGQRWLRRAQLPLEPSAGVNASALNLTNGEVLGYLTGSNGGTARVTWDGQTVSRYGGASLALKLTADGFGPPGTYTGTISLLPGNPPSGDVSVSIVYTDSVLWPILLLGLGIVVAVMVQKVAQVYRVVWQLQGQLAELGVTFAAAQERFAALTQGKVHPTYSIEQAVNRANNKLNEQAEALKGPLTGTLDQQAHTAVVTGIAALKDVIDGWAPVDGEESLEGFAQELVHLASTLATIERIAAATAGRLDERPEGTPAIVATLTHDLTGTPFDGVDEYRRRRKQIEKDADFADAWLEKAQSTMSLERRAAPGAGGQRNREYAKKLWSELWASSTAEEVRSVGAASALPLLQSTDQPLTSALGANLATIDREFPYPTLTRARRQEAQLESPRIAAVKSLAPVDYAARARDYRARLSHTRWLLAAVAFVVAIVTGLIALYFGKTWGTATDFVTAFFWGLTTQAALTGLLAALAPESNPLSIPAPPVATTPTTASAPAPMSDQARAT